MGLKLVLGSSGSGKSRKIYETMIKQSIEEPYKNFFIIVPDQFTMQTQMDLVKMHPSGGILNIDVLSFGRFAHRIFGEVGGNKDLVLDDTGKSLILRKVAANLKEELPVLGGNIKKIGYINQVKSVISEFMQYGVGSQELEKMITYCDKRGALQYKLKDLSTLYKGFLSYIDKQFITTEESLTRLTHVLEKSKLVKNSVVVFDGFTGFTPVQREVIQMLLGLCQQVNVVVTIDNREDPYQLNGEQNLFHLSKKTIESLCKLAQEVEVKKEKDLWLQPIGTQSTNRFADNEELVHLEKNLFRYPFVPYDRDEKIGNITILEAASIEEEVHTLCVGIRKLVKEKHYAYRDIAVITGDLAGYSNQIEEQFKDFQIPVFMDQTRGIVLNPFIEYIKSGLQVVNQNFSYESIFHYLKSGLVDFTDEEVDELENYVIGLGIRGNKAWANPFERMTKEMQQEIRREEVEADVRLARLNSIREKFMVQIEPLLGKKRTVQVLVEDLYAFIIKGKVQEKLKEYEDFFVQQGEREKAKEYAQIYALVMNLLDQVIGLIGEEVITMQEFIDLLDAGFGEMQVGLIPGTVDRVVVGDVERTRLQEVKALFFLGINDGSIPKNNGKSGIISDIDREFLLGSELELAPTPRQQMYIQKLYLYLNMTKPSEKLYLSYAKMNGEGKSLRPSYLIGAVEKLFPSLEIEKIKQEESQLIQTPNDGMEHLSKLLSNYSEGGLEDKETLLVLYHVIHGIAGKETGVEALLDAAFTSYGEERLGEKIARELYGQMLQVSVSRLEKFASCAYAHFLQYGLSLQEREEYGFENTDMGNIFHGVLEQFSVLLDQSTYDWLNFPEEEGEAMVGEALKNYVENYGNTVLFQDERSAYAVVRMERILKRAVKTLQYQLQKGKFAPTHYEVSFSSIEHLDALNFQLSEDERMKLQGRIDRIDTYETEENVYVKVIDYKSGNKNIDLVAMYYGLQLQLVVYLNGALDLEKRRHPDKEIVPAALLYNRIADPMVEGRADISQEEINEEILKALNTKGIVNGDEVVLNSLDTTHSTKSDVIPVEYKKDGNLSSKSSVLQGEELTVLSDYVNQIIGEIGKDIVAGKIAINPYEHKTNDACTYCGYQGVCGFDTKIEGYQKRELEDMDDHKIIHEMKEKLSAGQDQTN